LVAIGYDWALGNITSALGRAIGRLSTVLGGLPA
jgi:hypothetical protein